MDSVFYLYVVHNVGIGVCMFVYYCCTGTQQPLTHSLVKDSKVEVKSTQVYSIQHTLHNTTLHIDAWHTNDRKSNTQNGETNMVSIEIY